MWRQTEEGERRGKRLPPFDLKKEFIIPTDTFRYCHQGLERGGGAVADLLTPLPCSPLLFHWLFPLPRGIQLGVMVSEICSAPSLLFVVVIYVRAACAAFSLSSCVLSHCVLNQTSMLLSLLSDIPTCLITLLSHRFSQTHFACNI